MDTTFTQRRGMFVVLRILEYLTNVRECNGASVLAELRCHCGCSSFAFSYRGKQTKGILAPYIVKSKGQLTLKATCDACGEDIIVYASDKDGANPDIHIKNIDFTPFIIPGVNASFNTVTLKYNYRPEKMKTGNLYSNFFENCFVTALNYAGKEIVLIEE